jgi:hypothetical protein
MDKYCAPLFIASTLLHIYKAVFPRGLFKIKIEDHPTPLILDDLSLNNSVIIYISSTQMNSI